MKVALLVSTYNQPDFLELVLLSVLQQSRLPDEVLIADDGSREETRALIESFQDRFQKQNRVLKHFWQEDRGFRKSSILNKALGACSCDYVVEIDGDVILHKNFVKEHLAYSREKFFICARRAYINPEKTKEILASRKLPESFSKSALLKTRYSTYLPCVSFLFRKQYAQSFLKGVFGSNLSYWLKDAQAVNGYNEAFEGWGKEDNEFVLRLLNLGIKRRTLVYCALQYHLYHPENSRTLHDANEAKLKETLEKKIAQCQKGIRDSPPT